jgi:hypothetical protein
MRPRSLQKLAPIASFLALVAVNAACSSDDNVIKPAPTTGTMAGTGSSTGSGSTTSGTGSTTSGTLTSTVATGATGTAGAGGSGGAGSGVGGSGGAGTGGAGTAGAGTGGAGTGGAGGAGDSGVAGVCGGRGTRVLAANAGIVDDFETPAILPGWSSFNDVMPVPNSFMIMQVTGGALGTGHSGHYAGTGARTPAAGGYGVGTIFNMAIDRVAGIYCVDITAFDGVTFWARALTAGSQVGVNFVIPETNAVADGGDCVTGCFLHPARTIALTTTWAQYSVTFAEAIGSSGARVRNVLQLLGWLSPDANWDFSLDEIQLYKGTPPTGPVRGDGGA